VDPPPHGCILCSSARRLPPDSLFPYTTLFRSLLIAGAITVLLVRNLFVATMLLGIVSFTMALIFISLDAVDVAFTESAVGAGIRSEEHTSELQSRENLVCRLLLEKKNNIVIVS